MQETDENIIVIYGSVRSGTTMFRLMIGAHPDVAEIGENEFLVERLLDDGQGGLRYDLAQLDADRIFRMRALTRPDNLDGPALGSAFLEQLRDGRPGPLAVTLHGYLDMTQKLFPNARYIHICRDPRDVAASATRFGWSGNVHYGADFWLDAERGWEAFKATAPPETYCEVRYEDLVLAPHEHLERVCDFLGLPFDTAMLSYDENSTYSEPDPSLTFQWKRKLTPKQISLVEHRCGDLLATRNYERMFPDQAPLNGVQKTVWAIDNKLRKVSAAISFYGFADYAFEKICRLPFFKSQHAKVITRMQDTENRSLK